MGTNHLGPRTPVRLARLSKTTTGLIGPSQRREGPIARQRQLGARQSHGRHANLVVLFTKQVCGGRKRVICRSLTKQRLGAGSLSQRPSLLVG